MRETLESGNPAQAPAVLLSSYRTPSESLLLSGTRFPHLFSGGLPLSQVPSSHHPKASCASLVADSTNVAFTISMLLGNISSCCNPWIYMGFNSHLLPRLLRHRACCWGARPRMRRQLSSSSLSSRRTTLLTRSSCPPNLSLSLSSRPGPAESLKDLEQVDGEATTETSIF